MRYSSILTYTRVSLMLIKKVERRIIFVGIDIPFVKSRCVIFRNSGNKRFSVELRACLRLISQEILILLGILDL